MRTYLVLARKYRPRTFEDVIGQEVVTRTLSNALREGRIGHAYLFAGPRGTGKTTTARILAKCLFCEQGPTPTPCGRCEGCRATDDGSHPDLVEIDAASHTGVDDVRELREGVQYAPMRARHRVYLVDEVHMLSKAAFNALLKTLEEPPPHVVFLFATTEPHKVLPTVLSRCQVLRLQPLAEERIAERLADVLAKEGVRPGPGLVEEVARAAQGGMRDALSIADELLALAGNEPTVEDLRHLGRHVGGRDAEEVLALVEAGEKGALLAAVARHEGREEELCDALLAHLRVSLLAALCGPDSPLLPPGEEDRAAALERARRLDPERVELWMQELLGARERMRARTGEGEGARLALELALLDLARPETTLSLAELEARLARIEAGAPAEPAAGAARPAAAPAPRSSPRAASAAASAASAPAAPPARAAGRREPDLDALAAALAASSQESLADLVRRKGRLERDAEGAVLVLRGLDELERRLALGRRNAAAVARAFGAAGGRGTVRLDVEGERAGGAGGGDGGPAAPAARGARASGASGEPRAARGARDEFANEVADLFGGAVEELP